MRLLIHAPNVHQGGGRTLLVALLAAAKDRTEMSAIVDARLQVPPDLPQSCIIARVAPVLTARLAAEWRLRSLLSAGDTLLCFGNLPPLFGASGRVVLFLQNRYLLRRRAARSMPAGTRLRIEMERIWLRARLARVDSVIVQTTSMACEVQETLGVDPAVVPFAAAWQISGGASVHPSTDGIAKADFLYVASGEAHKNHETLLAAWKLLARDGIYPSLSLTVDCSDYPALCRGIDEGRSKHGLRISNIGTADPSAIDELYARSSALIYPSAFESFGLPLLEARARGLPLVAAELDYVRDVVDPVESFDPESAVSIFRAVKRFLGRSEPRQPFLTPDQFIDTLLAGVGRAQ